MSERPKSDLIETLRKILKKTEEAGCTQEEAEAAFRMASRLCAEHNLDMAEIQAEEGRPDDISWLEDDACSMGRWTREHNVAFFIVKEFFFVEAIITTGRQHGRAVRKTLRFFGRASNVESAKWAFNALLDAFDRLWKEYRARTGVPANERRLFVVGVAQGFTARMREERQAVEIERDMEHQAEAAATGTPIEAGGTALALRNIAQETATEFQKAHPKLGSSRSNFGELRGSQSTLQDGYRAGRSLNLNRSIGGDAAGRKALPGS